MEKREARARRLETIMYTIVTWEVYRNTDDTHGVKSKGEIIQR